ncbi:MAG: hypothetical protein F6K11_14205 [Leptolyngbya sp. SIO3F4]|nr:hypothetical protein [Leptolyngbya sp. SIO3F4]
MGQPQSSLASKLDEINIRLKKDNLRVAIRARGKNNYVYLVATLPPRPGSTKAKPYQQRISLGYAASVPGLRRAETQARLLATQLINQSFSWQDWAEDKQVIDSGEIGSVQLAKYKSWVFEHRLNREKYSDDDLEALWRRRYLDRGLAKLNIDRSLSIKDFEAIAKQLTPGTAQARYVTVELRHFAKFCGLTGVDEVLMPYQGKYNPRKPQNERVVPSDGEIAELIPKIINPQWRYVFGMMATYGLRNHEAWNAKIEFRQSGGTTIPVCIVSEGKTGKREVYPMPVDWVDLFDLAEPKLPSLSVSIIRRGEKTARAFLRQCERIGQKPKWRPYSLRHAYAIRCIKSGLEDAYSAKWMGHSIVTFRDIYSKWIGRAQSEDIWLKLQGN